MKEKFKFSKRFLSVLLSLILVAGLLPISAFANDDGAVPVGDFTIAPTGGDTSLTENTDYTYSDGKLTVTTATPVTIGMKSGVEKTDEIIAVDSANGEASVTFNSIGIDTDEDAAIAVTGDKKVTFIFTGESALSAEDNDGINVSSKTPFVITSTDNGKLSISSVQFGIFLDGYSTGGSVTISGNLKLDIADCTDRAIYCRNTGSATVSGTPVINIDTTEYAIHAHGINISGGTITVKNDNGYAITAADNTGITLSNSADLHIIEGKGGLRAEKGKITITDSAKFKAYNVDSDNNKIAVIDSFPVISTGSSGEIEISENAAVELYSANDAISGGKTSILNNAQVDIVIDTDSTNSEYALSFKDTLTISGNAKVDIDVVKGKKIHGIYCASGTANVSGSAVVSVDGTTYKGICVDKLNLSENASVTVNHKGTSSSYYAIDADVGFSIKDNARFTATSGDYRVLGDPCTVTPDAGKAYMVKYGATEAEAVTDYYKNETTVSGKSTWRYFHAEATDSFPVNLSFDANGGEAIDPITVMYNEKYGRLPSSAVTGLSGGDSNWYLVDENGDVTDTKITKLTKVTLASDHKLFVKRKVLAPSIKITLKVPGAISDGYQYYLPGNSQRILTAEITNQNTNVLSYTYQWYKDDEVIEGAAAQTLTLDGNVSDDGAYTVKVTATLKADSGIVVTESTATAEKSQNVNIMHAANTLYYDANGGEGGPSSNYTGGANITVQNNEPTREGYAFDGWNTKADGTGENYTGGDSYTFADDNDNGGCEVTLYAQWIKSYGVYVGGVLVTEKNKDDIIGGGTVSYDADTDTLTLNDADITGGYEYEENCIAGIYADSDLNIELIGTDNKVSVPDSAKLSYGIKISGDLNISGSGSLAVNGGSVTSQNTDADSAGIYVNGNLSIFEAGVTANGGNAVVNGEGVAYSCGVIIEGSLELDFGGSLTAIGGKAQGSNAYSSGLEAYGDEENYINVAVYDGYLNATASEALGNTLADSMGVYIYNGGLYLYDTNAKVTAVAGKATVTAEENAYASSNGIAVFQGDIGVDAGSLDVSGGSFSGMDGNAYAVYIKSGEATDDEGNPYSSGGYFNIGCDEVTPNPYGSGLIGTTVTIASPNGKAIYAEKGIDISDKLTTLIPESGEVKGIGGSDDPENWIEPDYWTVVDADGNEAQNTTIIPLIYKVSIKGLSSDMVVEVSVGASINETYCEFYEIEDFSEKLNTEKEGYTFSGWYTDEACTAGNEFTFDDAVTANITIYAKWVPVTADDNTENDDNTPSDDSQTGTSGNDTKKEENKPFDNTKTGDNSNIVLWFILLFVSGAGIFGTLGYRKRENSKKTK